MYDNKLLLEMIDIAIGAMVENELCYYCKYQDCNYSDCSAGIFDGLKLMAERNLNKWKFTK